MSDTTNQAPSEPSESREAFIARAVERALEPYRRLVDADTLAEFAAFMRTALECHPVSSELVARARPRAAPARSGEEPLASGALGVPDVTSGKRR